MPANSRRRPHRVEELGSDLMEGPRAEALRGLVEFEDGPRVAAGQLDCAADDGRQHGLEIKVARIFNTYGPRMLEDDGRVVSNFVVQALRDEPLTLYGEGQQTRSFCYVDDLIEGLIRLMNRDSLDEPVNL